MQAQYQPTSGNLRVGNSEFHASYLEERQNIPDACRKYTIIPSTWKQDMKNDEAKQVYKNHQLPVKKPKTKSPWSCVTSLLYIT